MTVDTKTQILDTALNLFAEQGFEATSLRTITACAGVNLASVHYHFGSKEGLLGAVVGRGFEPINQERFRRLDEARARAGDDAIPLRELLEAFLVPVLRLSDDPQGGRFLQLLGRLHSDLGKDSTRDSLFKQFDELKARFVKEFMQSLPELDLETVAWRLHFVVGSMAHTMIAGKEITWISDGRCAPSSAEDQARRLCEFAEAGLRASRTDGTTTEAPDEGHSA